MQASGRPTRDSLCLDMTRPSHTRLATIAAVSRRVICESTVHRGDPE